MKFIIQDMLFPTKLTSLINTRGLIGSASLENHHNNRRNSGGQKWPKTFLGRYISNQILPFSQLCQEHILSNSEITGARSKTPWHPYKTGASLTKTGALLTDNRSRSQPVNHVFFVIICINELLFIFTPFYSPFSLKQCMIKTHVRDFFDSDLHEVSWNLATREAVRPSWF